MTRKTIARDRGVSDVVAFTFVFSIIITSVGLVSAVGFSTLGDVQTNEQALNAQRAMQSLSDNLGEVQRGHAPGRTGELKLNDGTMYTRPADSSITVSVDGSSVLSSNMGTLYYRVGEGDILIGYEGGGVLRSDRGESIMIDGPKFTCTSNYAIVSVVTITTARDQPDLGGGTVQVAVRESSSKLVYSGTGSTVTVTVDSEFFDDGWDRYFGSPENGWTQTGTIGDSTASGECSSSSGLQVYVRRTVVTIDFLT